MSDTTLILLALSVGSALLLSELWGPLSRWWASRAARVSSEPSIADRYAALETLEATRDECSPEYGKGLNLVRAHFLPVGPDAE